MILIRHVPWLLTAAALLDVAPSCGHNPVRPTPLPPVSLEIRASDCTCARGVIEVAVDRATVGETQCAAVTPLTVDVNPGSHTVDARSGTLLWLQQVVQANGATTRVELGCPIVPSPAR
jgi:hypothetical protein